MRALPPHANPTEAERLLRRELARVRNELCAAQVALAAMVAREVGWLSEINDLRTLIDAQQDEITALSDACERAAYFYEELRRVRGRAA